MKVKQETFYFMRKKYEHFYLFSSIVFFILCIGGMYTISIIYEFADWGESDNIRFVVAWIVCLGWIVASGIIAVGCIYIYCDPDYVKQEVFKEINKE